ncbi:MAG: DUF393 domain-containing protein [Bacteroidota bacterium]|nr:DUF393 domain-containing protein [Bacteroidota bacterium]
MEFPNNKKIVLFDGACNLCNGFVQRIIKHDKIDRYRFAALNSDYGKKLQSYLGIDSQNIDSIVLYEPGVAYYLQSEAAIRILKDFGGIHSLWGIFLYAPQFVRNGIYNIVAQNRYNWFGRNNSCLIQNSETKAKFLE